AQHVKAHARVDADDRDAQQDADPIPADRFLEKPRHRAQRIEHHSSGLTPVISVLNAANAIMAGQTTPSRTTITGRVDCPQFQQTARMSLIRRTAECLRAGPFRRRSCPNPTEVCPVVWFSRRPDWASAQACSPAYRHRRKLRPTAPSGALNTGPKRVTFLFLYSVNGSGFYIP